MLSNSLAYTTNITKEYQARRDIFISTFENETGIKTPKPEGAFYVMLKLPIEDSEDFAKWLLTDFQENNETIMVAPGRGFYITEGKGQDEIRISFTIDKLYLKRSAQLLAHGLNKYISHR